MDDATICESILGDDMLHNGIVAVGVNPDVWVMRETIIHDTIEYTMDMWITCYSVYDMIGH